MAEKILVVDDNLDTVKSIGLFLHKQGYEIIPACNGTQALAAASAERPDLAILDVMMPDMDGFEVCRRLRADPATADLPVIIFTSRSEFVDKAAGFEAGAEEYLTKPVRPDELVLRVRALLRRSPRPVEQEVPRPRAKVLGFLGSKGGVGTTTLVVNLAVSLAGDGAPGKTVVLAELRAGISSAVFQLGLHGGNGMARLLDCPAEQIDRQKMEARLARHTSGVAILCGQVEPPGVALPIAPAQAQAILARLSTMADYVLLDLGIGLEETNLSVLPLCDRIVVTVDPQRAGIAMAQALLKEMNASLNLASTAIALVVIKRASPANTYSTEMIQGALQHSLLGTVPPAPELAFESAERGVPMVTMQPTSLFAQQVRALWEGLFNG